MSGNKANRFNFPLTRHYVVRSILVGIGVLIVLFVVRQAGLDGGENGGHTMSESAVDGPFLCQITLQNRFQYLLPIGLLVGAIVVAGLLSFVGKRLGVPQQVIAIAIMVFVLAGMGGVIWYAASPQGYVSVDGDELRVIRKLRGTTTVDISRATMMQTVWERRVGGVQVVVIGPMVKLSDGESQVVIGCVEPSLAEGLAQSESGLMIPPSYTIKPADYRRLIARLELEDTQEVE